MRNRLSEIDALKGIGIILVVQGHALGGLIDAHVFPSYTLFFKNIFAFIYAFHMPLFFFLSGLFVSERLKKNTDRFGISLITKIGWPYILWGSIQTSIIFLAGDLVNVPIDGSLLKSLLFIFVSPPSQFWFLHALFIMHITSYFAVPRFGSEFVLIFAIILCSIDSLLKVKSLPLISTCFLFYGVAVMYGSVIINKSLNAVEKSTHHIFLLPIACFLIYLLISCVFSDQIVAANKASEIFGVVSLLKSFSYGLFMIYSLFMFVHYYKERLPNWLIMLGQQSMPIYILHVMFVAGLRIMVLKFFPQVDVFLLVPSMIIGGLLGPVLISFFAQKLKVSKLLGFN